MTGKKGMKEMIERRVLWLHAGHERVNIDVVFVVNDKSLYNPTGFLFTSGFSCLLAPAAERKETTDNYV